MAVLRSTPLVRRPRFIDPFQPAQVRRLVSEFGSPLLILDCERVRVQFRKLRKALPRVDLHYALKPMPHPAVVQTVIAEGGFLDLATSGEVQLVQRLGVAPERCIHSHPIKREQDIANALQFGVRLFVADNPDDLLPLARLAADLGIGVRGLSFHVGSQTADAGKHVEALAACARLMAAARRERLGAFDTLDIGGGFPIEYGQPVQDIGRFCAPLRAAVARLPKRVRVIAEPGRYVVGPSAIGVASVMGRARREGHWWYYLDDGLYGSYSGQLFDHARYPVEALREGSERLPSVLAGPTCDSIDVIAENLMLPQLR